MSWDKVIERLAPAAATPGASSHFVNNNPADVIELLPATAAEKLTSIREHLAAARASAREISERQNEQLRLKFEAERAIGQLVHNHNLRADSDHPSVLEQRDRIARAVVEQERILPFLETRVAVVNSAGGLLQGIERWLAEIPFGVAITEFDGPAPKLGKGAPAQIVERCRGEIVELRQELKRVGASPLPAAEAKLIACERIDAIVRRSAPDVFGLFAKDAFTGSQEIRWPIASADTRGAAANLHATYTDTLGILCWLNPDAIKNRLFAEIDLRADDANAMSNEQRDARMAQLGVELLEIERTEEAAIVSAELEGMHLYRRRDASPIAVLGLASDLPAPDVL